jgi:hypothetical protein
MKLPFFLASANAHFNNLNSAGISVPLQTQAQGDHIGGILAQWATDYLRDFCESYN